MTINQDTRKMFMRILEEKITKAIQDEEVLKNLYNYSLLSLKEYKLLEYINILLMNINNGNIFLASELIEEKRKVELLFNAIDEINMELNDLHERLPRNYFIEARYPNDDNLRNDHIAVNGVLKLIRDNKQSGAFRMLSSFCLNYFGEEIYNSEFPQFNRFFINDIIK